MDKSKNYATFTGYFPFVPKLRTTSTSKVCGFALRNELEHNGEKRSVGCNCVAWGELCEDVVQGKTTDEITVEGYLIKQKVFPTIKTQRGTDLFETVLHVTSFTINGKTTRAEQNKDGTDESLPFDL